MKQWLRDAIEQAGFKEAYCAAPDPIPNWDPGIAKGAAELFADPGAAYPKAKCILILVYPYKPFGPEEHIPAYYPASNSAYFAAKDIINAITGQGYYAERAKIPIRAFALAKGIGDMGRNGLMRIPPYGSAIVLDAIATDAEKPEECATEHIPCPEGCTACAVACPVGAISGSCDLSRCMRLKMVGNIIQPEDIRHLQQYYIGCEACIRACPFNSEEGFAEPAEELKAAFDMGQLILGNDTEARRLTGKNMTGSGRLTVEAIVMAAREGKCRAEIEQAPESPNEAVREAAEWALNKYFSKT